MSLVFGILAPKKDKIQKKQFLSNANLTTEYHVKYQKLDKI